MAPISWPKDPSQEWCASARLLANMSATLSCCGLPQQVLGKHLEPLGCSILRQGVVTPDLKARVQHM